jgi:hypothetical protein
MSNREQVMQIIEALPEYKITGLLAFLRTFEDIPNEDTLAAMAETDEMVNSGGGQHFTGETADFLNALLEAED